MKQRIKYKARGKKDFSLLTKTTAFEINTNIACFLLCNIAKQEVMQLLNEMRDQLKKK